MSKEPKKEIDLMLRQLGRREGAALSESDEQHLDADELNSYVANALPSAARARYMEHLADCASCRKLVAQLSAAQGPVVAAQSGSIPASSGLKQFLASFLSPMVLRYAVPALGLIVIMVVGFVVMRRGPAEDFVATVNQPGENKAPAVQTSPSPQVLLDSLTERQGQQAARAEGPAVAASPQPKGESPADAGAATGAPSSVAVTANEPPISQTEVQAFSSSPTPVKPPAPKVAGTGEVEAPRRADSEIKGSPDSATPSKLAEVTVKERDEQNKEKPQRAPIGATAGAVVNPGFDTGRVAKSGAVAPAGAGEKDKRARDEVREKRDAAREKDDARAQKNEAAEETRSIAGRRFRKSGNVWIDTAYDSSRETFSLARGSEQYRALVADEPEIRRIAEQLDGEFIVVWKGRAYRIR